MDTLQPMAAVVLVLALLGGALYALRKRGAAAFPFSRLTTATPRRMQVLERLPLGPQHALHIVRVGNREVVVATAPTSCQLLCDLAAFEAEMLEVEA
jgi:flagellar biosynthetic protein FliO